MRNKDAILREADSKNLAVKPRRMCTRVNQCTIAGSNTKRALTRIGATTKTESLKLSDMNLAR